MALLDYAGYFLSSYGPTFGLIIATILLIIAVYYLRIPRNLPPGPVPIPWFGSPYLFGDDVHIDFDRLAKKYGDIFTIMLGARPLIVLNTNELIREAFVTRGDDFANRPVMYDLDYMKLDDELFNHRLTQQWKERKRVMVRILKNSGFGTALMEEPYQSNLDLVHEHYASKEGKPFKMMKSTMQLMTMTMAGIVFSGKYDSIEDKEVQELIRLATNWMDSVFKEGMSMGYWTDNVPHQITRFVMKDMMKAMKVTTKELKDFLIQKIHEHRADFDEANVRDVMDGYLAERKDDKELTDSSFSSTLLMLFPDAIDTAGAYLNYIVLYLATYPDWQQKVVDQIHAVCGSRPASLKDRVSLPLVDATLLEVGRIQTPVAVTIAHSPVKDTTLRGYFIPEDSYILGNISASLREKEIFPQVDNFEPWRMIDENGKLIRNEKLFIFGCGRRMCLADQLVRNELFLYVSNTLQRFVIKLPTGQAPPTLDSIGGLIRTPQPFDICMVPRTSGHQ